MLQEKTSQSFWPPRWWWLVLAVIVVGGGVLRFTGYDYSLPYIDHVDEPIYNLSAQFIIDRGSPRSLGMHGYPPGIIGLNYLLLRFFHDPTQAGSTVIGTVRLLSVATGILTLAGVALLGYLLATPTAGLWAAVWWAIAPQVVLYSQLATADVYVTGLMIWAFWLFFSGIYFERDSWVTAGLLTIIPAILFKYQAAFVLPVMVGGLALRIWLARHDQPIRQRLLKNLGNNLFWLGLFFFWLVFIYPTLDTSRTYEWGWRGNLLSSPGIPTLTTLLANAGDVLPWIGSNAMVAIGLAGVTLLLVPINRHQVRITGVIGLLVTIALFIGTLSIFGQPGYRHFLPMGALLVVVVAIGLDRWAWLLAQLLRRTGQPSLVRYRQPLGILVVLLLLSLSGGQLLSETWSLVQERSLPDRRNELTTWMDESLPPGSYIGINNVHKIFSRPWGGYAGVHDFPKEETAYLTERPPDEWRAAGVSYAIVPYGSFRQMVAEQHPYLDEVTILKTYPPSDAYRGPNMAVLRLSPIQHAAALQAAGQFGPINLIGYDLDQTTLAPGDTLTFRLYWQADAPTDTSYVVYNHLIPLDGREPLAQVDGPPLFDEAQRRTTVQWNDPAETLVSRAFTLPVPADVPPGEYRLITGFYRPDTWERLTTPAGEDFLLVSTIEISEETATTN